MDYPAHAIQPRQAAAPEYHAAPKIPFTGTTEAREAFPAHPVDCPVHKMAAPPAVDSEWRQV